MENDDVQFRRVITANWFTQRPRAFAWPLTLLVALVVYGASYAYWNVSWASEHLSANGQQVFQLHEWWRPWTTLLVHGDLAHLLANSLLLFLFSFLLQSYFSVWFFPVGGLLMGGLANVFVLLTMNEHTTLVGASGLVHWMGAAWATLYVLLERRQQLRPRFAAALFLMLVLFTPDTYKPNVSYLAHLFGFILGVLSAWSYWRWNRRVFAASEVVEYVPEPPWEFGPWDGSDDERIYLRDEFRSG